MSHSLDFNIREKLAEYLAGKISLDEFEDWFFPETIEVAQESPLALIKLVYGIKLSLAEFSHGDWSESEFRGLLRSLLQEHIVGDVQKLVQYGTSSTNMIVQTPVAYSNLSTDRKFSVGYA
jgi:hypothetical protein